VRLGLLFMAVNGRLLLLLVSHNAVHPGLTATIIHGSTPSLRSRQGFYSEDTGGYMTVAGSGHDQPLHIPSTVLSAIRSRVRIPATKSSERPGHQGGIGARTSTDGLANSVLCLCLTPLPTWRHAPFDLGF